MLLLDRACDQKLAEACTLLGTILADPASPAAAPASAAEKLEQACDLGDSLGCTHLAVLLREGRGVLSDTERALSLLITACDRKVARACALAAELHAERGEKEAATRARERACELGFTDACPKPGTGK